MKRKILALLLFASLLVSSQAEAVKVRGRNISTISDIVRAAGGVASEKDTNIQLPKNSYFRVADFGQELELTYDIGHSNTEKSLGSISGFQNTYNGYDLGLVAAVSKTMFGNQKVVISSTRTQYWYSSGTHSNWLYYLYFLKVGRDEDGNISQSRFGMWHYPRDYDSGNSGFIKDIKAGISVEGFDGELVIAATMETTNDNPGKAVKFSDKKVKARLDFWALYGKNGEVQYRKVDELNIPYYEDYTAVPLLRVQNANDDNYAWRNSLDNTTMSPYIVMKVAVGDFNNDGFANEVAMVTADLHGIYLMVYQLTYNTDSGKFAIKELYDRTSIYWYEYPGYFDHWCYNGWNRVPGADIVAGNFDSDAQTEFALIFQGDFPANERDGSGENTFGFYGGMVKTLRTKVFKWDNEHGTFNSKDSVRQDYYFKNDIYEKVGWEQMPGYNYQSRVKYGYEKRLDMSFGGLKAVATDIDGDGTDEVVIAGYRAKQVCHAEEHYKWSGQGEAGEDKKNFSYEVSAYLAVLKASDGKLEFSDYVPSNDPLYSFNSTNYVGGRPYQTLKTKYPFNVQNYELAPVEKNEYLYPVVDREISIVAGPMFGRQGKSKLCDDVAIRLRNSDGGRINLYKSNGSSLSWVTQFSAVHTSALVTADFVGEGVALGSPTHIIKDDDVSYMMVLQDAPYHVDNISEDGKTLITMPINYSYHKDGE